jgi:hypothetical protein
VAWRFDRRSLHALINLVEDLAGLIDGEHVTGIAVKCDQVELTDFAAPDDVSLGLGCVGLPQPDTQAPSPG